LEPVEATPPGLPLERGGASTSDQISSCETVGFWFSPLSEEAKGISLAYFKGELEGVDLNKFGGSNPPVSP